MTKPQCTDVLSPDFETLNPEYDPSHPYCGAECFFRWFGNDGIPETLFGVSINKACFLHDKEFEDTDTLYDYFGANKRLRQNIYKLFKQAGKPIKGRLISFGYWIGVSGLIAKLDYWLCKKEK